MSEVNINYQETCFQYHTLTEIHGKPIYSDLAKLEKEILANGKSVPSNFGDGNQGHLGIVCSTTDYKLFSPGVPFVRPVMPVLNLIGNTPTQNAAKIMHKKNMKVFNACRLVEGTIKRQIIKAVDHEYLANHIDNRTGELTSTIPHIIASLFKIYGRVTPQALTAAKTKVEGTTYDHTKRIVHIFNTINNYGIMAAAESVHKRTAAMTPAALNSGNADYLHVRTVACRYNNNTELEEP